MKVAYIPKTKTVTLFFMSYVKMFRVGNYIRIYKFNSIKNVLIFKNLINLFFFIFVQNVSLILYSKYIKIKVCHLLNYLIVQCTHIYLFIYYQNIQSFMYIKLTIYNISIN